MCIRDRACAARLHIAALGRSAETTVRGVLTHQLCATVSPNAEGLGSPEAQPIADNSPGAHSGEPLPRGKL